LKEDIELEALTYKEISMQEIHEFFYLESTHSQKELFIDTDETSQWIDSPIELEEFRKIFFSLKKNLFSQNDEKAERSKLLSLLNFSIDDFQDITNFQKYLELLKELSSIIKTLKEEYKDKLNAITKIGKFKDDYLVEFKKILEVYEKEKVFLLGYLFKNKKILELNDQLHRDF